LKNILTLALQEIKVLLEDKQAVAVLFLMPTLLILFLSLALTDVYNQKVGKKISLAVLLPKTQEKLDLTKMLRSYDYQIQEFSHHPGIDQFIKENRFDSVLELPENTADLVQVEATSKEDSPRATPQISVYFDPKLDKAYQELLKSQFAIAIQARIIERVNENVNELREAEGKGPSESSLRTFVDYKSIMKEAGKTVLIPNPIQQTVPAWALFAMFFIVIPLSNSFIRDRQSGVLNRLMVYNISRPALFIGKLSPYIFINMIQFFLMLFVGIYLVPKAIDANFEIGHLDASIALITLICSLAATSYGLMVSTICRTSEHANSFGAISIVIMALLGGVMIPHFVMPDFMQNLSFASPLFWGLESYLDMFLRGANLYEIAPRLYILLGFVAGSFLISVKFFKWS
jgi:ABC-2 type transport system permease protein